MTDTDRQRAFMAKWLAGTLAPGDRVVAGVRAVTGPSPYLDLLPMLLAVAVAVEGWRGYYGPPLSHAVGTGLGMLSVACALLTLFLVGRRHGVYLAVTEQQIVAVQLRGRNTPVRVLFATPVSTARLATKDALLPPLRTIWCGTADGSAIRVNAKTRGTVRLTVRGRAALLADVLTAVRIRGGGVNPPALPAVGKPVGHRTRYRS